MKDTLTITNYLTGEKAQVLILPESTLWQLMEETLDNIWGLVPVHDSWFAKLLLHRAFDVTNGIESGVMVKVGYHSYEIRRK